MAKLAVSYEGTQRETRDKQGQTFPNREPQGAKPKPQGLASGSQAVHRKRNCFGCGLFGHILTDCPKRKDQSARGVEGLLATDVTLDGADPSHRQHTDGLTHPICVLFVYVVVVMLPMRKQIGLRQAVYIHEYSSLVAM